MFIFRKTVSKAFKVSILLLKSGETFPAVYRPTQTHTHYFKFRQRNDPSGNVLYVEHDSI